MPAPAVILYVAAMGFFGNSMLIRADVDVITIDIVRAAGGHPDGGWSGSGGWRFARVHRAEPLSGEEVRAVAEEVSAPFLAAYVVASDFAEVWCAAPGQPVFRFVLHPRRAADYDCPVDSQEQHDAVPRLLRWAGQGADEDLLRAAVHGGLLFAEDSVLRLAAAAGAIPAAELAQYTFGPTDDAGT
jgi:hypothetical protein